MNKPDIFYGAHIEDEIAENQKLARLIDEEKRAFAMCGPVTIKKPNGDIEVKPPYTAEEAYRIVHHSK